MWENFRLKGFLQGEVLLSRWGVSDILFFTNGTVSPSSALTGTFSQREKEKPQPFSPRGKVAKGRMRGKSNVLYPMQFFQRTKLVGSSQ